MQSLLKNKTHSRRIRKFARNVKLKETLSKANRFLYFTPVVVVAAAVVVAVVVDDDVVAAAVVVLVVESAPVTIHQTNST